MGKKHNPRRGSLAYSPRVRAKRSYPRVNMSFCENVEELKPFEFAGYKVGMTQVVTIDDRKNT